MKLSPEQIFGEYTAAEDFKNAIGTKGLAEQKIINERFFIGDQWYGAKCGNDRPLVRHNVIKRIGDFKMAQVLGGPVRVTFGAEGVPSLDPEDIRGRKKELSKGEAFITDSAAEQEEVNVVMSALSDYYAVTAERVKFESLSERALRNAYISGSGVIYTYWDETVPTGLYADSQRRVPVKGDICCEVLDIENVCFGDPYIEEVQNQPYIIIAARRHVDSVRREALSCKAGGDTLRAIEKEAVDGKITVLTRLYKEYKEDGSYTIKCTKVTSRAVVRPEFDTGLRLYPLALFTWERRGIIYGESEITYLIPNQIAINRMITASVWASMANGMPIMVINGDTVPGEITNDPGQIIRIFGSSEDVAGAVRYVTPPDAGAGFGANISSLIENTLTQSGANQVALGDSRADNATALSIMRDAATLPLQLVRGRFHAFIEDVARIWADFWITQYGNRRIKIEDENGTWFLPFNASRYKELIINTKVDIVASSAYNETKCIDMLNSLYEKGIIDKKQYLKRIPAGIVPDIDSLVAAVGNGESEKDERK